MSLGRQIVANYVGSAVSILAPVVTSPIYLHALGPEQWGLLGVVLTLVALLALLDHGIHQTLLREFAIRSHPESPENAELPWLLHRFARLYWTFALIVGVLVVLLSKIIATRWLHADGLDPALCWKAIALAGIFVTVQIPGLLYGSALIGTGNQVAYNAVFATAMFARHAVGIGIMLFRPNVLWLIGWYVAVGAAETAVRRHLALRIAGPRGAQYSHSDSTRLVFTSAAGMSAAVLLGALSAQIDKVLLSGLVSVEVFGYYAVAANVSLALLNLVYPIVTAALPRLAATGERSGDYHRVLVRMFAGILCITVIVGSIFWLGGRRLLLLWLRDAAYAANVWNPLSLLLIGTGLNALYNVGYAVWVARGAVRPILFVNVVAVVLSAAGIPWLVGRYGIRGAAMVWIITNAIRLACSCGWMFRTVPADARSAPA
jgi:O-antigen/teichoic acid export membrane protein